MSHDKICTSDVSVVRINGNMLMVGKPTHFPYDAISGARIWRSRARTANAVKY